MGAGHKDSNNIVDVTNYKVAEAIYMEKLGNPFNYQTAGIGATTYKPTAGEQVHMMGLLFGTDAAKKYAQQLAQSGITADTPYDKTGPLATKSYQSMFTAFVGKNNYLPGFTDKAGQFGVGSNISLGDQLEREFAKNIELQTKKQLTDILANTTGLSKDTVLKLSNSEFNALADQYLGTTLTQSIKNATADISNKLGMNITDLGKITSIDQLKQMGWGIPKDWTAANVNLSPSMVLSYLDSKGTAGYGMSTLYSAIDGSLADDLGVSSLTDLKGLSGSDISSALGIDTSGLDFNLDAGEIGGLVSGYKIQNVDPEGMAAFNSGGSGSGWIIM